MPYIEGRERHKFDAALEHAGKNVFKKGELTYCIYKLGVEVMKDLDVSYENLTMIRSTMLDAADEWWDEKVKPYERKKKRDNGDVL
jgi:predicted GTPase